MPASNTTPTATTTTPLTIAVADDVPEIQALAQIWLTAVGHRVICATNGAELLRAVRAQPVDLVITDVLMPEADGFEVINELKHSRPQVKIISISGGANVMPSSDCLRVAKALGAEAVLAKPFTREQLLEAVAELMAR